MMCDFKIPAGFYGNIKESSLAFINDMVMHRIGRGKPL